LKERIIKWGKGLYEGGGKGVNNVIGMKTIA
jgi:hypothetical protein